MYDFVGQGRPIAHQPYSAVMGSLGEPTFAGSIFLAAAAVAVVLIIINKGK